MVLRSTSIAGVRPVLPVSSRRLHVAPWASIRSFGSPAPPPSMEYDLSRDLCSSTALGASFLLPQPQTAASKSPTNNVEVRIRMARLRPEEVVGLECSNSDPTTWWHC